MVLGFIYKHSNTEIRLQNIFEMFAFNEFLKY